VPAVSSVLVVGGGTAGAASAKEIKVAPAKMTCADFVQVDEAYQPALVYWVAGVDKLGVKGATLKGDVTRRWTKVTDPTTLTTRQISNLHPVDWNLNFTQDVPRWNLSWGVNAFGGTWTALKGSGAPAG